MITTSVLCPLDGSAQAERALTSAIDAAQLFDLPFSVFSAVEDEHLVERQTTYLEKLTAGLAIEAKIEVVVDPHPPRAIVNRAGQDALVVMATSTQPLIHRGYLGSAAEAVVRDGHLPVLLVGPRVTSRLREVERIVACCDGSSLSEQALPVAAEWTDILDASLWVVTVAPPAYRSGHHEPSPASAYVHRLAATVDAQWEVLHGTDAARSIAVWSDLALVVMTSHGRTGWSRLKMGSVTTATVRWASSPVLVLGQH